MNEKGPPPLPGDTNERTVDYGRGSNARKRSVDSLLPPGADEEPGPPPLAGSAPMLAEFIAPQVGPRESVRPLVVPEIDTIATQPVGRGISTEEKAQRRFWKNVVVFGVCLVALMIVCFLLAR
jgi:hypothetical protein